MSRGLVRSRARAWAVAAALALFPLAAAWGAEPAPLQAPGGGRVLAFVVGANRYANFSSLDGAVADAEDIFGALKRGGVTDVTFLKDEQATRKTFVATMNRLVATAKKGDMVLITFSGHGNRVPELPIWKGVEGEGFNEEFVLPGYDTDGPGVQEVVMNKEMKAWLSRLDQKGADVLLIADTCFGGGMTRGFDPRAKQPKYRVLRGKTAPTGTNGFQPIPMSRKELLTSISDLGHVTAIAGGDSKHLVPEVTIPGAASPRGALSYSVARAIEGAATDKASAATTRFSLLAYALQIVQQYSAGTQLIDSQPQTEDESVLARPVFRFRGAAAPQIPDTSQALETAPPLRVGVLNGNSRLIEVLPKGISPFVVTDTAKDADLIYDVDRREVLQGGDVIKQNVEPQEIPGIVDRTKAIADIKKLSESRVQTIDLRDGGKRYTPSGCKEAPGGGGGCPQIEVKDIAGQNLLVFNIAAEGRIQRLRPTANEVSRVTEAVWRSGDINVVPPFGADTVVAVVSGTRLSGLETWLQAHEQQAAAGLLVDKIKEAIAADPKLKLGLVGVYTGP